MNNLKIQSVKIWQKNLMLTKLLPTFKRKKYTYTLSVAQETQSPHFSHVRHHFVTIDRSLFAGTNHWFCGFDHLAPRGFASSWAVHLRARYSSKRWDFLSGYLPTYLIFVPI